MRFFLSALFILLFMICSDAQIKILHYTETSGFDHQTRNASFNYFNGLALILGYSIDNDSSGDAFSSLVNLQSYEVVIFSNTTGDAILDSNQRNNFEQYIAGGGNVLAIHSATDTYRHSTANGINTGVWDYFPELIGASVQQNPNHVNGTPVFTMHSTANHQLLFNIPSPWSKAEEYYYWEGGYYDSTNNVLLIVETTGTNSYDSSRATTWYRTPPAGNRVFYTSLGHLASNFNQDPEFQQLMRNALLWCIGLNPGVEESNIEDFKIWPNPFSDKIHLYGLENFVLKIYSLDGRMILNEWINSMYYFIDMNSINSGVYIFRLIGENKKTTMLLNCVRD